MVRQQNTQRGRRALTNDGQQFGARHARHLLIRDDDLNVVRGNDLQRLAATGCRKHLIAQLEQPLQEMKAARFVID